VKINIDNKYQTRSGLAVRLISDNGTVGFPIIGVVEGRTLPDSWQADGKFLDRGGDSFLDLVPVPVTRTAYINVYPSGMSVLSHPTRARADENAASNRIACVKVTYTKGQFDE
jgi:hypothetical protein